MKATKLLSALSLTMEDMISRLAKSPDPSIQASQTSSINTLCQSDLVSKK